jgi:hypothetical protein
VSTASIEFTLPEERWEHLASLHGPRLASALREVDEYLRRLLKDDGIKTVKAHRLAEEVRAMIADDLALVEE